MSEGYTLGDLLPREMARVRDEVLPAYLELPENAGQLAAAMIRESLDSATRAMIAGDLPGMIRAYQQLKNYST